MQFDQTGVQLWFVSGYCLKVNLHVHVCNFGLKGDVVWFSWSSSRYETSEVTQPQRSFPTGTNTNVKDICKDFFLLRNWEKPCWTNWAKCFNSYPEENQVVLKYNLPFSVEKPFDSIIQYFRQSDHKTKPNTNFLPKQKSCKGTTKVSKLNLFLWSSIEGVEVRQTTKMLINQSKIYPQCQYF